MLRKTLTLKIVMWFSTTQRCACQQVSKNVEQWKNIFFTCLLFISHTKKFIFFRHSFQFPKSQHLHYNISQNKLINRIQLVSYCANPFAGISLQYSLKKWALFDFHILLRLSSLYWESTSYGNFGYKRGHFALVDFLPILPKKYLKS